MSAINDDGSLNISLLERQVKDDVAIYLKSRAEDRMKKRAIRSCQDYDDFKHLVSVSQLKPTSGRDVSAFFNSGSRSDSTFRNKAVQKTVLQSGIGGIEKYIEKRKDEANNKKKNVEVTMEAKGLDGKATLSATKSSRDAHNFLSQWKRQCSSASLALSFIMKMQPDKICQQYFSTEIDVDIVGAIIGALHLLVRIVVDDDDNGRNDYLKNDLISANLLEILNANKFITNWLKALTFCSRFNLTLSFLTPEHELQLKEIVKFLQDCNYIEKDSGEDDYLRQYNIILKM